MYTTAKPLFFRTETPLHAGSGSDLGHIDLPIQREKHTDFPSIQSSSLKGAFREHIEGNVTDVADKIGVHLTFGFDGDGMESDVKKFFDTPEGQSFSGALAFTDARILFFPLKSYKGIYALATCPMIIKRLAKELNHICGITDFKNFDFKSLGKEKVAVANKAFLGLEGKVFLEEYAFEIAADSENSNAKSLAEELAKFVGDDVKDRLVILPDDVFRDFVRLSTEVITRTKIQNDTGTVQARALFTEEYLPAESYMYSLVAAHRIFQTKQGKEKRKNGFSYITMNTDKDVMKFFKEKLNDIAQIGGSSTLGKGIVKLFKSQL